MRLSPSRLLFIDQFFFLPYRILEIVFEKIVRHRSQESDYIIVVKLFGKGSLIYLLNLSKELNTDFTKVLLITSEEQRDVCEWMGIRNVIYINASNLRSLVRSSWSVIGEARKFPVKTVISLERCSYAVNSFALILSIRNRCKNICFEVSRTLLTKGRAIYSAEELTIAAIFKKCLEELPFALNERGEEIVAVDKNKVIVNINASDLLPARRYSRDQFAEVINMLIRIKPELQFVLIGSQRENEYAQYLTNRLADVNVKNVAGDWSLAELTQEISSAAFVLTNDSMPLHMAAFLGVPVVALWGPTQPQHFGYNEKENIHSITLHLPCSPCFIHPASKPALHCQGRINCISDLQPAVVTDLCKKLLLQTPAKRVVNFPHSANLKTVLEAT